jgi:hypothetical protein
MNVKNDDREAPAVNKTVEMIDVLSDEQLLPLMKKAGMIQDNASRDERRRALKKARAKLRGKVYWKLGEASEKLGVRS